MVERGADAERECCRGGSEAEGDLNKKTQGVSTMSIMFRDQAHIRDLPASQVPGPSTTTSCATVQSFHP
jgi:hypothetical protein